MSSRPPSLPLGLHRLSWLNVPLGGCMGVCADFCASVPWVVIVGLGVVCWDVVSMEKCIGFVDLGLVG